MTQDELIDVITEEIKGLSSYFVAVDYENATTDALRETGWSFNLTTDFRTYWAKTRSKRHLFFMLMSESAHKFKYEQINLQHRFDHYSKMIADMDEQFAAIMEDRPEEFLDAMGLTSDDAIGMFGSKVDAGFSYSPSGVDTTYDDDNEVNVFPNEDQ